MATESDGKMQDDSDDDTVSGIYYDAISTTSALDLTDDSTEPDSPWNVEGVTVSDHIQRDFFEASVETVKEETDLEGLIELKITDEDLEEALKQSDSPEQSNIVKQSDYANETEQSDYIKQQSDSKLLTEQSNVVKKPDYTNVAEQSDLVKQQSDSVRSKKNSFGQVGAKEQTSKVSVKELSKKFKVEEETGGTYCLAKPLKLDSDQYCLAKPVTEDPEVEGYIKANKVNKSFVRKPAKYKYDPPWNSEFPMVMVPGKVDQGEQKTFQKKTELVQGDEQNEVLTEVKSDLVTSGELGESGKYNHLFEGSVSEEPEMSNLYGIYTTPPEETDQPQEEEDVQDTQLVPALPILISSGVYSNAYEGNFTSSMRSSATIRSQENPYEDVHSRGSDIGWNSSEFESSGSDTDFENAPGPEDAIFDKPLPPTPKELAKLTPEKVKKKEESASSSGRISQILPVKVNLEKHPPPCLPPAPEKMENHQIKRRYAIQSLVDSEKSFIDTLRRLSEEYKDPLLTTYGLQGSVVDVILCKAEQILDIHKMFQIELADKVKNWDKEEEIGNTFIGFFSREMVIELYSGYVNNFSSVMEELKSLQSTKPALANFLTEKAMKSPDRLPLFGLLVKPVQRFPQFITMMQDLLKYTPHQHHDRSSLQTALTDLENVAHKLNESKRLAEQKFQAKKVMKELNIKNLKTLRLLRQDDLDQICETANNRTKVRRLFLTDTYLICTTVTQREQDGRPVDRIRSKWAIPISELELKDNAISPELSCSVRSNGGLLSIHTRKESIYQESDPLNLQTDLDDMVYDYHILGQISSLVSTLKCGHDNLSEETCCEVISDLQRKIQVKNQQLQIINSCTVVVEHTNATNNKKERYTFQTVSPELKQEWSTDFLLSKLALDPINNPSWTSLSTGEDVTMQPALFMKHLPVDMPRYFTKMKCAIPVYLASHGSSDIGIQHLWVVMTTDLRTQVALVSVQNTRPSLVESFQACSEEVVAVEIVPGYAVKESGDAFMEDTVWMSTVKKEVLIFSVFNEQGLRDQTKLNRVPKKKFHCHGIGQQIHYTIERVFIGTDEGVLVIYDRNEEGVWNFESPNVVQLASSPINSIITLDEEVWVACGQHIYIIPVEESCYLEQIEMTCKDGGDIAHMVRSGVGLWISHKGSSSIHLYHIETKKQMQEINVAQSVNILVQANADESLGQESSCEITSLMVSKGFLWVGTSSGILLTFPLPRLKDGVPIISGRPFVSYHGHNGPVQFLIPIYCGTVNLWHKARGLDYSTVDLRRQVNVESDKKPLADLKQYESKRHSSSDLEKTVSQISLEGDYIKMTHKPTPPEKPPKSSKTGDKTLGGVNKENRLSRSADDITKLLPSKTAEVSCHRGKTLKYPTKLASRQNIMKNLDPSIGTGEDDVNEVYRDLMRNESMTAPVKPVIEKQTRSSMRKPSFNSFKLGSSKNRNTKHASVRVSTDEPKLRALDTLSKRGCNSVMIVMGGDGYIDWRKKSSSAFKNLEAALIIWLYKF
ncbi:rho guanine nucleotide exchange factor 10-like isoform X2 [Mytilus californianus]|uniref:rho guanine nucleotide exchange factor 10-like isoform X2 n=1 Tax=Mytilus californianus TaxID=6549 RepID=UPI0022466B54|nr:rho guanine nucleotide exchange factor 10-like isoform X2 [Mytilus californianus]